MARYEAGGRRQCIFRKRLSTWEVPVHFIWGELLGDDGSHLCRDDVKWRASRLGESTALMDSRPSVANRPYFRHCFKPVIQLVTTTMAGVFTGSDVFGVITRNR